MSTIIIQDFMINSLNCHNFIHPNVNHFRCNGNICSDYDVNIKVHDEQQVERLKDECNNEDKEKVERERQ